MEGTVAATTTTTTTGGTTAAAKWTSRSLATAVQPESLKENAGWQAETKVVEEASIAILDIICYSALRDKENEDESRDLRLFLH
jgi:hypothetical protein